MWRIGQGWRREKRERGGDNERISDRERKKRREKESARGGKIREKREIEKSVSVCVK